MSLRARRGTSAFAMFKSSKKAASLSNVTKDTTPKPSLGRKTKSHSANTTPTNSSMSSSGSSDRSKKAELKKIKKLLKSASKKRPSFLPDHALQSPLNALGNGNVELRSMKQKVSMSNTGYPVPLRATPDITAVSKRLPPVPDWDPDDSFNAISGGHKSGLSVITPPLPPKQVVKPMIRSSTRKDRRKRGTEDAVTPELPPRAGRVQSTPVPQPPEHHGQDDSDVVPPRPAKRRRISQGSAPPSPGKSTPKLSIQTSVISPEGARERMEPIPSHPQDRRTFQPYMFDSKEEARRLFECLIHPVVPQKFFSELWEKKPLLVKRHQPGYNDGWFSTTELDRILREEQIKFGEHLDVVSYENGKRETHNVEGKAYAAVVWDYYQNGCSVRMLNPQTYSKNVWKLLSILQEYFGCCVGANIYLTPPGTQGFAPHYDDIEAFILQLEGKKHWKLYSPRTEHEVLPRTSSANLTDEDIGEPILDVILEAGDLLYFPRGTIHQGRTMEDDHSLHITVSCYQKNTWADILEKLVPQALQIAITEDVEFRKALPKDYLNFMGVAFSDKDCPERQSFLRKIEQLMRQLTTYAPVDAACDQLGKRLIHDSLPPMLTETEKFCSIHGQGERWDASERRVVRSVELEPDTQIKLIRRGCARLVTEDDVVSIYHNMENARIYHANTLQQIEITPEMAPAVEYLLHSYPEYVEVDSLPLDDMQDKIQLVSALYDKGLIVTREPLEPLSEGESDTDLTQSTSKSAQVSRKNSKREK